MAYTTVVEACDSPLSKAYGSCAAKRRPSHRQIRPSQQMNQKEKARLQAELQIVSVEEEQSAVRFNSDQPPGASQTAALRAFFSILDEWDEERRPSGIRDQD